jgi:hypothetical protein
MALSQNDQIVIAVSVIIALVVFACLASGLNVSKVDNTPAMRNPTDYGSNITVHGIPGVTVIPATNPHAQAGGNQAMPLLNFNIPPQTANRYPGGNQAMLSHHGATAIPTTYRQPGGNQAMPLLTFNVPPQHAISSHSGVSPAANPYAGANQAISQSGQASVNAYFRGNQGMHSHTGAAANPSYSLPTEDDVLEPPPPYTDAMHDIIN